MRTHEEVKAEFARAGITVTAWARENGYAPSNLYAVLNGRVACRYGQARDIAVRLGLVPDAQNSFLRCDASRKNDV